MLLMLINKATHSNSKCFLCGKRILKGQEEYIWDCGRYKSHKKCEEQREKELVQKVT